MEAEDQREIRLFRLQFEKAGLAEAGAALERWVTTGDEAARDEAIAAAPEAAEEARPDWGRPLFLARDGDPRTDRLFEIVVAGFDDPTEWLTWATNSLRVTGRFTAAIRYLQRRAGLEERTPTFPWSSLGFYPPAAEYFPVLDALLEVVAVAQPELLPHARQRVLSCFFGAADLIARDAYAERLAVAVPSSEGPGAARRAAEPERPAEVERMVEAEGFVSLWIDAELDPKGTLDGKGGPLGWIDHDDWETARGVPARAIAQLSYAASFAPAALARATELGITGEVRLDALFRQKLIAKPGKKRYGWFLGSFPYTRKGR